MNSQTLAMSSNPDQESGEHQTPANFFAVIHRLFRGRYSFAVPAVLLLAIAGGVAGYVLGGPVYTSTGVIRILPTLPRILYSTELTEVPQGVRFQQFVKTQAALITTDRVLQRAIEDKNLPPEDLAVADFRRLLDIRTDRDAPELIYVTVTTRLPSNSRAVVSAAISSYMELYGGRGALRQPELINTLEELKRKRQAEIRTKQNQIRTLTEEWGTENLGSLHEVTMSRIAELTKELRRIDTQVFSLQSQADQWAGIESNVEGFVSSDLNEIISVLGQTPQMVDLAVQRTQYQSVLRDLESSGIRTEHRSYRQAQGSLLQIESDIRKVARRRLEQGADSRAVAQQLSVATASRDSLATEISKAQSESIRIGAMRSQVDQLNMEIDGLRTDLKRIEERSQAIALESKVEDFPDIGSRISIISPASMPIEPSGDSRRKLGAFGFVGTGGLAFMSFALVGVLDRRLRYSDDLSEGARKLPLLAVLPSSERATDEFGPIAIANTIHRIRIQLQRLVGHEHRRPIVVTSSYCGEGKTSVVLSLGLSYAHAGYRVLLVDFDLVGRALTRHLSKNAPLGLTAAVAASTPQDWTQPTQIQNLSLLGSHPDDELEGSRFTAGEIDLFFDRLAAAYDVVLVDTGPLLGGIETSIACTAAEGVILVVGRGTAQSVLTQCMDQIQFIGATAFGLVFNRASHEDFFHSPSSQSQSTRSRRPERGDGSLMPAKRWCEDLSNIPLAEVLASTLAVGASKNGAGHVPGTSTERAS